MYSQICNWAIFWTWVIMGFGLGFVGSSIGRVKWSFTLNMVEYDLDHSLWVITPIVN